MKKLKGLKIYSWKTFFLSLIAGVGSIIYYIKELIGGDGYAIFYIIFWGYLFISGMWSSLTKEGFEDDKVNGKISKIVYKRLFGRWWAIAPWGGLILLLLALITINLLPSQEWLWLTFFITGAIYHVVGAIIVGREVKREKNRFL